MTKKIFSFLNDGETSEENQRHQSIQNSMLYRTVRKEKREIVKNIPRKTRRTSKLVQFSIVGKRSVTKKIFTFFNDGETLEENQRHHSIQNSMLYRTVRKEKREIVKNCVEKGKKKEFRSVFYQEKDQ